MRVVIRKDDNKRQTRSGIVLPDSHEIPVITGRVIAISKAIENDEDQTIRQYDKVLFDPARPFPSNWNMTTACSSLLSSGWWRSFGRSDQSKQGATQKIDQEPTSPIRIE